MEESIEKDDIVFDGHTVEKCGYRGVPKVRVG